MTKARRPERSKPPKQQNLFFLSAMMSLFLFAVVEVGTLDLRHELTYFHTLSQQQSAWARYALLFVTVGLFVVAASRQRRP